MLLTIFPQVQANGMANSRVVLQQWKKGGKEEIRYLYVTVSLRACKGAEEGARMCPAQFLFRV